MLNGHWSIATLSGDMGPRAGFGHLARRNDLLICTAELLQMALTSSEEEEHVELNGKGSVHPSAPLLVQVVGGFVGVRSSSFPKSQHTP